MARTTKQCTRCSKRRKVEQFHRDKHTKDACPRGAAPARATTTRSTALARRRRSCDEQAKAARPAAGMRSR